jgi:O-antigen/teichoic acid export membrane protein
VSVFLDVLMPWAIIAAGTVGAALALVTLTGSRTRRKQAKPGQWSAWQSLCASGFLILSGSSQLLHGTAAWVALSFAGCLACALFIWGLRSLPRSRSRPTSGDATAEPS